MLSREGAHGPVIHDINRAAANLGLRREARITDMRALVPDMRVEEAMPDQDRADLATLAHWAQRWCPWSQTDGVDGLFLDTTGSDHLHGGEAAMLADMRQAFARIELTIRTACAPTPGAAWALARHGMPGTRATDETLARHLAPLPVAALRLKPDTVTLLHRLGLKTIAALAAVPRDALVRRFRQAETARANPVLRLDQAMGRLAEPLVPVEERLALRSHRRMMEPVATLDGLTHVLEALAGDLCRLMETQGRGARRLRFTGYRVDGLPIQAQAETSLASRDPAHLIRLFDGRFDALDAGFGIEVATLEALTHDIMDDVQDRLDRQAREDIAVSRLIDRLMARLGPGAVRVPAAQGSHIPERASVFVPALETAAEPDHPVDRADRMPLRLLRTPEEAHVIYAVPEGPPARIVWRRLTHLIVKSEGPERIAPEWWREGSGARLRDYYRIEDSEGRRYWIYREGLPGDGRGDQPRWFVHGIDA